MVKPLVFSYRQYEELREAYKALLDDNQKLMADNKKLRTKLQIATRIIEYNSKPNWIPFTRRPMTEEEQEDYPNCTFILDCDLPDDGDEILVSNGRFVWMDTFCNDIDGCYLDGGDDIDEDMAWQPLPKPHRPERIET